MFYPTALISVYRKTLHFAMSVPLLVVTYLALLSQVQAQNSAPLVERCTPSSGAVNSVLALEGYRLGAEETMRVKAFFARGDLRISARTGGSRYIANDVQGGSQALEIIVPEQITPGQWQLFIEVGGQKTAPLIVTITEWTPPALERLLPARVRHGEAVWIFGTNFHVYDEIEITDSLGQVRRFPSGASSKHMSFTVPKDVPEGEATVRVGLSKGDIESFSQPLKFIVTSGPISLELWVGQMKPVAPGQWADLVVTSLEPLEHSERTEVEFRQGSQISLAETLKPNRLRVHVPAALAAGAVELRTRTWVNGLASQWSEPQVFQLLENPSPPFVEVIDVGAEKKPVFLWEGPDRPTSFAARAGDALILRGHLPALGASEYRIMLEGARGQLSLTPMDVERGISVLLPRSIRRGDWQLIILDASTGLRVQLPIVMRIS